MRAMVAVAVAAAQPKAANPAPACRREVPEHRVLRAAPAATGLWRAIETLCDRVGHTRSRPPPFDRLAVGAQAAAAPYHVVGSATDVFGLGAAVDGKRSRDRGVRRERRGRGTSPAHPAYWLGSATALLRPGEKGGATMSRFDTQRRSPTASLFGGNLFARRPRGTTAGDNSFPVLYSWGSRQRLMAKARGHAHLLHVDGDHGIGSARAGLREEIRRQGPALARAERERAAARADRSARWPPQPGRGRDQCAGGRGARARAGGGGVR